MSIKRMLEYTKFSQNVTAHKSKATVAKNKIFLRQEAVLLIFPTWLRLQILKRKAHI